jgi:hypothetical protein
MWYRTGKLNSCAALRGGPNNACKIAEMQPFGCMKFNHFD